MSRSGTRAPNGMGSIRRRADGKWEGRYSGADGRQHSVYGKTQKDVSVALRAATHGLDEGSWLEPSRMTVAEWVEVWLRNYQADTAERTVDHYRGVFRRHIVPVIGNVKLSALGQVHVQRVLTKLKQKSLADSTIKAYMNIFSAALNQARRSKLIRENPIPDLALSGTPKKEFHIIDRPQLPAFFAAAKQTRYPEELAFGILTGLRVGELRGLRWEDVDLDAGTVHVCRQLRPAARGRERISLPKYRKKRLIHIPAEAVALLRRQRVRQAEQRLAAGEGWCEDETSAGLVFRQGDGRPHSGRTIERAVHAVGRIIGIPALHPHDLRHSYAVAALRAGADVKTVQHNLGHSSVKMTLDVYAAYTQDAGQQGAEKLSGYLQGLDI